MTADGVDASDGSMPAAFIGHGNPMNALEVNRYTTAPVVQLSINDWAQRFDEDAKARMMTAPTEFATLDAHRDFRKAVPTPDHFIPALYLGLAGASDRTEIDVLVDGYAFGSLSMTAYTLGVSCLHAAGTGGSPQPPAGLPPDESNI